MLSGKQEEPEKEAPKQITDTPIYRRRFYFYEANPVNGIKFSNLKEILDSDSPEKETLIRKLQGGLSGRYWADYFVWKKLVIVTNQYDATGKNLVVYEVDLNSDGSKNPSTTISPDGSPVTAETFEKDLALFSAKNQSQSVLNLDTGSESFYSGKRPPENIPKLLLARSDISIGMLSHGDFIKIFDEYRIFVKGMNQLMLPNNDLPEAPEGTPKGEEWAKGAYPGGQKAFEMYIAPYAKGEAQEKPEEAVPEEEGAPEKEVKAPANLFKPVTSEPAQPTIPRQAVWQVVRGYTEKRAQYQQTTTTPAINNPATTQSPGSKKGPLFPGGTTPQEADKAKKMIDDYKKVLEQAQKL